MTEWKYYDFDANWKEFYEIWKSHQIQDILKPEMDLWCLRHAYYIEPGKPPIWNKGEPLWNLSRTDYHWQKMLQSTDDKINKENIYRTYRKRMEQITGRKFVTDEDDDKIFNRCFKAIMKEFEPKPHTIDSLILMQGKNYMLKSLLKTARLLFPNDTVIKYRTDDNSKIILIVNKKLVFDLFDFYFSTRDDEIPIDYIDDDLIHSMLNTFQH